MQKFHSLFLAASVCMLAIFMNACGPASPDVDTKETDSSKDNTFIQTEFDAMSQAFEAEAIRDSNMADITSKPAFLHNCATVSLVSTAPNYTLTIDFGTGCLGQDGRTRSGKWKGVYSGTWGQPGSTVTITPENYTVTNAAGTSYTFNFSATCTYNGYNSAGHRTYLYTISNASAQTSGGDVIRWNSSRTIEWVDGQGSTDVSTYKYNVTGSASGTATNDIDYTATILSPLQIHNNCQYRVVAGTMELKPEATAARQIDFGSGVCDDKASLVIGSFTTTIILR